ncbi:MAG: hypothetical protein UV61_C0008G0060 [Candidatus Gottesmanbacteria bacterium GW2011_GWB1_43_11]|uniref:Uncharacterized protein n=1 Tax=Candidatus Gottesmanbacteria bacterium GW2011_GWB1_43_11 TaxID=1618446 RepID=A0A0G1CM93_9BACT|nr:MAG: hypothetical protein UV04_C0003G0061 [Candidatus Gottesmanbacteria bacterium GW2011_GWA2_42_16]KKS55362.1 MAG: hypothetical protein UV17_C0012G0012 [Candidatus Gottesmanbacteria bacterium GW2011_GWA1_42_26]KKS82092.1 MAG: hypothetical protein UV55_C0005G0010 [Candidatus Gottesmanbacteria bacterium GW2011_GWC1_43_10]KKS86607.1 MAG: hypothetical protein UV61_C0008G0060 [Candidatus Gottesmanbacteria bacterium GW2011_GWB1_43_11]OGG09198.1 MAG: hypothetical protein A2699_02400 [Candidatus Go
MADGIAKGIGEQLGELGKQIVTEVANVPAKITGLDSTGTNETTGQGAGAAKPVSGQKTSASKPMQRAISEIAQKDEIEKQKRLFETRQLLKQFSQPQASEQSIKEKLELEELEKQKKEIAAEKKKARAILPKLWSKPKSGNLYGIKAKAFGGEVGKNVKAQ